MKFKQVTKRDKLNESLVSEDKYRRFILSMMGESGSNKFTAGISYDKWFSEASAEERQFSSFASAKEWCERTLRQYDKESIAFIVKANAEDIQVDVCLCFDGRKWYFYTGE